LLCSGFPPVLPELRVLVAPRVPCVAVRGRLELAQLWVSLC